MFLIATASPQPGTDVDLRATVARLVAMARRHELVVVTDWAGVGVPLAELLTAALPRHDVVLVNARLRTGSGRRPTVTNARAIRRLVEDGAVVVCMTSGPEHAAQIAPTARWLNADLRADELVEVGAPERPAVLAGVTGGSSG